MTNNIEIITLAIVTLALGQSTNLDSYSEKNADAMQNSYADMIWNSNVNTIKGSEIDKTGVHGPINLFSKHLQTYTTETQPIHKKQSAKWANTYFDLQYREGIEFNITRYGNWDSDPDNFYLDVDENQNIQRKTKNVPKVYNFSAIVKILRNYHELIGIPLAEKIVRAEKNRAKIKHKLKNNFHGRVAGGSQSRLGDFPFMVSMPSKVFIMISSDATNTSCA